VCNQKCLWCINENIRANGRKPEYLDIRALQIFLNGFQKLGGKAITWSGGGEPTCHPDFIQIVEQCAATGLDQALITNGTFGNTLVPIIAEHMKWIRISLDTIDPNEYRRTKGSEVELVIDTIANLVRNRRAQDKPTIGVNVNLGEWNFFDIENIVLKCEALGVDYVQFRPILGTPFSRHMYMEQMTPSFVEIILKQLEVISRVERSTDVLISKDKFYDLLTPHYGRNYTACRYHRFFCVLNANGDLSVCMFHLNDERFTFGNIYNTPMQEIWKSERRERVLQLCERGELDLSTCQVCCKGHEINKFLSYLDSEEGSSIREVVIRTEEIENSKNYNFI
jgi:radical SAM protein with 4Fe4S-binding SPASM domain